MNTPVGQRGSLKGNVRKMEMNENKNAPYQNLWAQLKHRWEKMYSTDADIRKEEKSQMNNVSSHLKNQEKKIK